MSVIVTSEEVNHNTHVDIYNDDGTAQHVSHYESVYITEETPVDDNVYVDVLFDLYKAKDDQQLVSGWASVSINKDGSIPLDWQGDVIPPEVLEKAAIGFMEDYRGSGEMHNGDAKGVVVESIVLTKDKQQALGIPEGVVPEGWFVTVKVYDPEAFQKVKDGTYRMFSIQGTAKRLEL